MENLEKIQQFTIEYPFRETRKNIGTGKTMVGYKKDNKWIIFHDVLSKEHMHFMKTGELTGSYDLKNWW